MKRNRLSPNLTFEEFKALASREPNTKGDFLYEVNQAIYSGKMKNPYPRFELSYYSIAYFKTFEDAEKYVKENRENVYCSWISQIRYGQKCDYWNYLDRWLYDQNGELVDYTVAVTSDNDDDTPVFLGRSDECQRFKVGDIVEVIDGKYVSLAVLNYAIPSIEWCWRIYSKRYDEIGFFYPCDATDDSAVVIDGASYYEHEHVGALQLLKPRFPIPEDIKADMLTWNERCTEENDDLPPLSDEYRENRQQEEGEYAEKFYTLNIFIHFDPDTHEPHLHINDHYGLKVGLHIDRPEYYDHDEYTDRLTDNQLRSLQHRLSGIEQGKSRWWYMLRDWNEDNDNPDLVLPLDTPIPNYTKLISK